MFTENVLLIETFDVGIIFGKYAKTDERKKWHMRFFVIHALL